MKTCKYMESDWFKGLQREVANSTKADVARKMGICRAKLSQVMNGIGAYGNGTASTAHIEREYQRTFETITCPHTAGHVDISYCREVALASAPTQNPLRMMHWQSCQQCENKPKPIIVVKPKRVKQEFEAPQQAGVIDSVTLPLPEVGGPQVMEAA